MAQSIVQLNIVDKVTPALKKADVTAQKFSNTIKGTGGRLKDAGKGASLLGRSAKAATPAKGKDDGKK